MRYRTQAFCVVVGGRDTAVPTTERSEVTLKQFLQETCSTQLAKCLMAEKLSLTLLHTDILVRARCPPFHGTRVFNNTFPSNIWVLSMLLCYITQPLPCCTMNFLHQSSVDLEIQ